MTSTTTALSLREHLDRYLTERRGLGYQLETLEHLAGQFCDWLTAQNKSTFTIDDAVTWARLPADAAHAWWGIRLGAVRTFARYLAAIGMDVQVPPAGLLPIGSPRAVPYIYSQADLDALLAACAVAFTRSFVPETMRTVVGLLAATGMRIGEALRTTPADIDAGQDVLTVRSGKSGHLRQVPLHSSTTGMLLAYRDLPARRRVQSDPDGPLFVSSRGAGYHRATIETYFIRLACTAGLQPRAGARPRLHDLRHTFATTRMITAYRDGTDPQATLSLLATWLGHTSAAHTYWYLTATPELMALAAARLEEPKSGRSAA
jgi:integrase